MTVMGLIKRILKRILPDWAIRWYHITRCRISLYFSRMLYLLFGKECQDPMDIPIIINNYNRLSYLKELISSIESRGYRNICIIDNASTYPPLLDFYRTTPYRVFRLDRNIGYLALWKSGIYREFRGSYYVYTDSDMKIDEECPDNFMARFVSIMERYPRAEKVGFGIRTDDLPDHYKNKRDVVEHESQFWRESPEEGVYRADIDTTFALYRPFCKGAAFKYREAYRTGFPYVIRHLPWYVDSSNITDEERYYIDSVSQSTHWSQRR